MTERQRLLFLAGVGTGAAFVDASRVIGWLVGREPFGWSQWSTVALMVLWAGAARLSYAWWRAGRRRDG